MSPADEDQAISPHILKAIVAAHRAIACERAARIEPVSWRIWLDVAEGEHRKKRMALAQFAYGTTDRGRP